MGGLVDGKLLWLRMDGILNYSTATVAVAASPAGGLGGVGWGGVGGCVCVCGGGGGGGDVNTIVTSSKLLTQCYHTSETNQP